MPAKKTAAGSPVLACWAFQNIQSLKLGHFILQSVTIWSGVEVLWAASLLATISSWMAGRNQRRSGNFMEKRWMPDGAKMMIGPASESIMPRRTLNLGGKLSI